MTDSLKDGITTYNGDVFKEFQDKPQVEILSTGDSVQAELQHDLAIARLQLAVTQALCAYIDETNGNKRVKWTDTEFVHNGAKVRVGEVVVESAVVSRLQPELRDQLERILSQHQNKREKDIAEAENILRQDLGETEYYQMLSGDWRPNSMYTSQEDQERYGQGDGR
jgi:hypothetical protein